MRSRLVGAGTLSGQTRLDAVKFFADSFSELAHRGRRAKRELHVILVMLRDTAPHRKRSPATCEGASYACPRAATGQSRGYNRENFNDLREASPTFGLVWGCAGDISVAR